MNTVLAEWNRTEEAAALEAMMACCGARRWAAAMVALRPLCSIVELSEAADRVWATMGEADWLEAFACHPRIGERKAAHAMAQSVAWSRQEQSSVATARERLLEELAEGNMEYEKRVGFTYIVCATGKSADDLLAIARSRLKNDPDTELRVAAEEQRKIMQLRLAKLLERPEPT